MRIAAFGFLCVVACGSGNPGFAGTDPVPSTDAGSDAADAGLDVDTTAPVAATPDAGADAATPCTLVRNVYPDRDGDGFGDMTSPPWNVCAPAAGYVANNTDCADDDPRAHPGQTEWQTTPIVGRAASGAFDFDCDGSQTPQWTGSGICLGGAVCNGVAHVWNGDHVAACGETAMWIDNCSARAGGKCDGSTSERTQSCR